MRATRVGRLKKVGVSGLVALLTASGALVFLARPAEAAAPVLVNSANSSSTAVIGNWAEGNAVASSDRSGGVGTPGDALFGTLVVQHDPGRTVTGVAIDGNFDAADDTPTVAPVAVTSTQVPGGDSNYSTVRYSFNPGDPVTFRGTTFLLCALSGSSQGSGTIRLRAVLDDGTRTGVVSNVFQVIQPADCGGTTEFPTVYAAQQNLQSVVPGGTVQFQFKADDPDGSGSNDAFDKYRWRVRSLNTGAIVQGPTCVDLPGSGSDNANQTLNVTFAAGQGRGRYVVETELGGEDESCPSGNFGGAAAANAKWFRLGAVDVNSLATSTTLTLAGAPAVVQAGNSYTVTATATDAAADVTGRIQAIEWDADGDGGALFERRVLTNEPTGIVLADRQQLVTTVVGQCADRTVRARIVDNGAMNGSDPTSRTVTANTSSIVNCAPVANDQGEITTEDNPVSFSLAPTDGDGDPLTYSVIDPPDNGAITGTYPSFVYDPDDDFNGVDSYTYRVDDINGGFDTATVTFTVNDINDTPVAQGVTTSTPEDTDLVLDLDPYISDPDEPAQTLLLTILTGPLSGTATVTGPAEITYDPPANFNGAVSIVYQVDDQQGESNSTAQNTINITVDPVDDVPVAAAQSVTTPEDTNLNVNLGPNTDVDGENVTYTVATPPLHGEVDIVGTVATYDPEDDYFGSDTFTFTASDGNSSPSGLITIDVTPVNDAPVAEDQSVTTPEDQPLGITLTADDVDNVEAQLTYEVIAGPNNGTLDTTTGPGIVYTPDDDYFGPDALTFRVTDPGGLSTTASVTIDVTPVNDAPTADDLAVSTNEDDPVATLLTADDIDNPQDDLVFTITDAPDHGVLTGTNDDLVYTPNLNHTGPDSFTFQVDDQSGGTDEGIVTIDVVAVNDPPTAIPQDLSTPEDTNLPIVLDATDPDDAVGDLVFEIVVPPSHGALDPVSGQATEYAPDLDYNGFDSFVFKATDPDGQTDLAVVTIAVGEVGTNDPPVAEDQTITTDEDTAIGTVLEADDVDGDDLTFSIEVAPSFGTAGLLNGVVIYEPNLNYHGSDLIVVKVEDGNGGFGFGSIHVNVTSVNDAPEATPATVTTLEDTPVDFTLEGSDTEGDDLTFAVATQPAHGDLTGTAPDLTYTPDADYVGNDAFDFTVDDGNGGVTTGTISIVVQEVPKTVTVLEAHPVIISILTGTDGLRIRIPASAKLTDAVGHPLAGRTVEFTSGQFALCTAVTDSTGRAACSGVTPLLQEILNLGYTAIYRGTADELPSSDTAKLIKLLGIGII